MDNKVKSSYLIPEGIEREMRIEAAKLGLKYPSEFILMLWEQYKKKEESDA